MQAIRRGDRGGAVVEIRTILTDLGLLEGTTRPLDADGVYDAPVERAVRAFQQMRGLHVTGDVNEETWRALDAARWRLGSRVLAHEQPAPIIGDDVRELQERLLELGYDLGRADGILGRRTAAAIARFQREVGLVSDGVCGPATFAALRRLGRKVVGGRPNLLRETERFRAAGPALVDKRIVIDPGHGGGDPGVSVPDGRLRWTEADIAYDLAARLEGRLAAAGMRVHLTRGPSPSGLLSEVDRASLANELGADLLISIHLDGHPHPGASGVATYYYGQYGDAGVTSTLGERLAALVQREIVVRTGLQDCRTHAKTWDLLRLTRMPAVRVEAGYLTSPADRERLVDPRFRDRLVAAIVAAVRRMYLPIESDIRTGSLDVSTLRSHRPIGPSAIGPSAIGGGAIDRPSGGVPDGVLATSGARTIGAEARQPTGLEPSGRQASGAVPTATVPTATEPGGSDADGRSDHLEDGNGHRAHRARVDEHQAVETAVAAVANDRSDRSADPDTDERAGGERSTTAVN